MRTSCALAPLLIGLCLRAEPLAAQTPSGVVGRVELSASAAWIGAVGYSTADANELDRDGNPFRLFRTEGEMAPTVSYGARFSVRLSDMFELETSASYATPELIVRVSDDFEDAEAAEVSEILHQIRVEGGILQYMRRPEPGRRNLPFVVLGAAFLRDLHEDQTLAENGQEYFVGAGLKYAFLSRAGASLKASGVRLDARAVIRVKGAALDDRVHVMPVVGASLYLRF